MNQSLIYRLILPVASLAFCVNTGCSDHKLAAERDEYRSQSMALTTQKTEAEQKLTESPAALEKTKQELATAKANQETAETKQKAAQDAMIAAEAKHDAAAKDAD